MLFYVLDDGRVLNETENKVDSSDAYLLATFSVDITEAEKSGLAGDSLKTFLRGLADGDSDMQAEKPDWINFY